MTEPHDAPSIGGTLSGISCAGCGNRVVVTVAPGTEPEMAPGGITLSRGVAPLSWCFACWPCAHAPGGASTVGAGDA